MAVSDTGKCSGLRQQDDEHCYNVTQQLTKISNRYSSMCRPSVNLLRVLGSIREYSGHNQFCAVLHSCKLTNYCMKGTHSLMVMAALAAVAGDRYQPSSAPTSSLSTATTVSLLDRLQAPRLSDLVRKTATKNNPPRDAKRLKPPRSNH